MKKLVDMGLTLFENMIYYIVEKDKKIDMIIAYENGELTDKDTLKLFAKLIKTGQAWSLQGHYRRTAQAL